MKEKYETLTHILKKGFPRFSFASFDLLLLSFGTYDPIQWWVNTPVVRMGSNENNKNWA